MIVKEQMSLRDQLIQQARLALRGAHSGNEFDWTAAMDELRPVLLTTQTLALLRVAVDLNIYELSPNLFVSSAELLSAHELGAIEQAYHSAITLLEDEATLVIVNIENGPLSPKHYQEVSGLSLVELGRESVFDRITLAHEFAHAIMSCGHRMLDEGLAEWVGAFCAWGDPTNALEKLRIQAEGAPPIEVLASRAWRTEPAFESLKAPRGAPHARAALAVVAYVEERGLQALKSLFRHVAEVGVDDIRTLLSAVAEPSAKPVADATTSGHEEISSIKRQFWRGDANFPPRLLETYRNKSRLAPDDRAVEEAYLKILLLEAGKADAEGLRAEVDEAVEVFLARDSESPLAFVLCICREANRIQFASDYLQLNDSFSRAQALTETAMELHGDDVDVLSTAAKLELRTPIEYGRNTRKARNLLLRAAAASSDPSAIAMFKQAANDVEPSEGF
jgi:hypothetical protein